MDYETIIDFWFTDISPEYWFQKDDDFDRMPQKRFGRYPHRNDILGRESTPQEVEFLAGPDSSF